MVALRFERVLGALGGIRTPDPRFRRPMLYPLSYERVAVAPERPAAYIGQAERLRTIT